MPSTIASFWAGAYLWRFQEVLPQAIAGITVSGGPVRGAARIPLSCWPARSAVRYGDRRILGSAGVRRTTFGVTMSGASVLVGFGFVALATLLVGLLEAVGSRGVGSRGACVALRSRSSSRPGGTTSHGIGLMAGAATVVVLMLPVADFVLSRPATTLATRLRVT